MDKFLKFFGKDKSKQNKKEADARNINSVVMNNENVKNTQIEQNKTVTNTHQTEETIVSDDSQQKIKFENTLDNPENNHKLDNDPKSNDVVIVNSNEKVINKAEGFYYKKYINQIQKLQLSNPILVEREKMKVNFDSEVMDYLVNDMTFIFREKQNTIDNNQVLFFII